MSMPTVVKMTSRGLRGDLGIDLVGEPTPGQFLVSAPGGGRRFVTATGTGADAALREDLADTAGSDMVGLRLNMADPPASGSVAASVKRRRVQAAIDYGLPADQTDWAGNDATIAHVLDGLEAQGGGVMELPRGWAGVVHEMIDLQGQNVGIEGHGGRENMNASGAGAEGSTRIIYDGAPGVEAIIKLHTPVAIGNIQRVGGGVRGVSLEGQNKAGNGIYAYGRSDYTLEQIFITGITAYAVACDGPDSDQMADAYGTQGSVLRNITVRLVDGGAQNSAHGFIFTGAKDRNFSFNVVEMCDTLTLNGDGFIFDNCDTNIFELVRGHVGSGGAGWAMTCRGAFRVDGEVANVGALPSPPAVAWPIGTTYRVASDGSYRRWNGSAYFTVTAPPGEQIGSVGCFGNSFLRPSWGPRVDSPGFGNIRWLGADDGFWNACEANHFIDVDDGNASLYPAYISSDARPPRNRINFTFEPRDIGAIFQQAVVGTNAGRLRHARAAATPDMPLTVMRSETALWQQWLNYTGAMNLEEQDSATVRWRSPDNVYSTMLFYMKLRTLGRMQFTPGSVADLTGNGDMELIAVSNTSARIAYRGSDGVTRMSAPIALS